MSERLRVQASVTRWVFNKEARSCVWRAQRYDREPRSSSEVQDQMHLEIESAGSSSSREGYITSLRQIVWWASTRSCSWACDRNNTSTGWTQVASYMNDSSTSREQFTDSVQDNSVYMLQTIQVDNKTFSLFWDSGCGDFVSRHNAIQRLGSRSLFHLVEDRFKVTGVGDIQTQTRHSIYNIKLPLADGGEALMASRYMDRIIETFPT